MNARPLPQELDLSGRTIAITGAASGIGRATASVVVRLGGAVVLTERSPLEDTVKSIGRANGPVRAMQADMTDAGFIDQLLAHGPLDGLIHCAARYTNTPLQDAEDACGRFADVMDINVRVPAQLGTACIEHMAGRHGRIVLMGSVAGRTGGVAKGTAVDYAASKGALHTVVRWLARQAAGHGVLVNGIAPGPIQTPMVAGVPFDLTAQPLGRLGRPEEIAWVAAFLMTPAASFMTGAIVDVNGGTFVGG